jgi:hypothetical protein
MSSLLIMGPRGGLVDSDGRPNPGLFREKLDIKGLQLFKNNPKPERIRIRGRWPRVPYGHGVRSLVANLKKAICRRRKPENAGGKI